MSVVVLTQLITVCREAAAQFRFYEQQHLAKTPPDLDKARVNGEWAQRLDAVSSAYLRSVAQPPT